MTRADFLKMYLAQLAADTSAQGKFVGAGSDRAEAAARAILNGGAHMLEALLGDVKQVAGDHGSLAANAVASFASRAVEHGVQVGIGKAVDFVKTALDKDKRAKRAAGKALMDFAKRPR